MSSTYRSYQSNYADDTLRGVDITSRPALVPDIVQSYGGHEKVLLDIGCGTAYKSQNMAEHFGMTIGLEPSLAMLKHARNVCYTAKNIRLIRGVGQTLPLHDQTIDAVTAILTWWEPKEIYRVLKSNGVMLVECLGPDDKTEFTKYFGKDEIGWRGANLNTNFKDMIQSITDKLSPLFSNIDILNLSWQTTYTHHGLWQLLTQTYATVRNFDQQLDKTYFDKAIAMLSKNGKVTLTQNRLVIQGIKEN